MSGAPEVTVLVPTYMAEEFIDRTMLLARGQTYRNISILVSVDVSTDETAAIVERHAAEDDRVRVVVQGQRLGWAGNVNFLLDQVTTRYSFIYFHDDVLVPQYVERLIAVAERRPDAASVHCNVGRFGDTSVVEPATPFDGAPVERLLTHLLKPRQGAPLRALLRSELTADVRIPNAERGGRWANMPFLVAMVAAGPALALDETLYYRWTQREGGLVDGWRGLGGAEIVAAWRDNVHAVLETVEGVASSDRERDALITATFLRVLRPLTQAGSDLGQAVFERPADIHPAFAGLALPPSIDGFGPDVSEWADVLWQRAVRRQPALQP